ncbi:hypothetical protein GCM10010220_51170 [Streptomyces parvulus]|nr:hypothetical protein GCM10010220_51170 [Streptomyces parvulus]
MAAPGVPGRDRLGEQPVLQVGHGEQQQPDTGQQQDGNVNHGAGPSAVDDSLRVPRHGPVMGRYPVKMTQLSDIPGKRGNGACVARLAGRHVRGTAG